jgi:hypothetical protein
MFWRREPADVAGLLPMRRMFQSGGPLHGELAQQQITRRGSYRHHRPLAESVEKRSFEQLLATLSPNAAAILRCEIDTSSASCHSVNLKLCPILLSQR